MLTKPTLPANDLPGRPRPRRIDQDTVQLHRQIRLLTLEVAELEERLLSMRQSTSWRVSAPLRWLSRGLKGRAAAVPVAPKSDRSYAEWVRCYDTLPVNLSGASTLDVARSTSISVILAGSLDQKQSFKSTIESILAQVHVDWELIVFVDPEAKDEVGALLARHQGAMPRVSICLRGAGESTARAFKSALDLARSDWVVFLECGDMLAPAALGHFAAEMVSRGDIGIVYCDEDRWDEEGRRSDPYFKPGWNLDLFYSQDYVSRTAAYARSLVASAGGLREEFGEAALYDLALRCIEGLRPEQIVRIPRVLWHRPGGPASAVGQASAPAEHRALDHHLRRIGVAATISRPDGPDGPDGLRRVQYSLPAEAPWVTLIIPTRNALSLVRQCVESIVALTRYPNYEIVLVDNGSDEPDALTYLSMLDRQPGITVIRDDRAFNYSALNNMAARYARGSVLGLVNNDIEVISADWLDEMVSLALQPGVGAVGAKLLYPDGSIQHGGVLLGVGGIAGHANKFVSADEAGYMNRARLTQSFSAVTAACLVVRKSLYEQVGGLNEVDLKIAFNDLDFCLRLREAGYRNVWTPYAELFHHESATRGSDFSPAKRERFDQEQAYMRAKWGQLIADDPAYNPNLTVYAEDFGLAWPPRVPWISGAAKP